MRYIIYFIIYYVMLTGHVAADPAFWRHEWPNTDFSKADVPWIDIQSGGPGKDGIPALSAPKFRDAASAVLPEHEPVLSLSVDGGARAYPLRYLIWHELVNDQIAGRPVLISFCPLCNSAVVFDRQIYGQELHFGVTGKLRHSDMIMYDVETQSWWQQAIGRGVVGQMTGVELKTIPSVVESVTMFRDKHPTGQIMAAPSYARAYGRNPYVGYDTSVRPFLYNGELPPHGIAPLARVIRVGNRAWPMERLAAEPEIFEVDVRIRKVGVYASALGAGVIASAARIPSVEVTRVDGTPIVHDVMFAFAFHAFHPNGQWMLGRQDK
jgi:hypothetical protein